MIVLNVFFKIRQASEKEFLQELRTMVSESNKEAGCSFYQLWKNDSDPKTYTLIEHWDNSEVLKKHQGTAHWQHFDKVVNNYLTEHYSEHHYEEISQ